MEIISLVIAVVICILVVYIPYKMLSRNDVDEPSAEPPPRPDYRHYVAGKGSKVSQLPLCTDYMRCSSNNDKCGYPYCSYGRAEDWERRRQEQAEARNNSLDFVTGVVVCSLLKDDEKRDPDTANDSEPLSGGGGSFDGGGANGSWDSDSSSSDSSSGSDSSFD